MRITDAQAEALADAAAVVNDAKGALKDAQAARERLVRDLVADGYSCRSIAIPAGLSYQRVAQITGGKDDRLSFTQTREAYCPKCGAAPGAKCEGSSGMFHAERHQRRAAIHDSECDDVVEGEPTYVAAATHERI